MNILKLELKRSLFNKWTLISFGIVSLICALQCIEVYENRIAEIQYLLDKGYEVNANICYETPYSNWILCYKSMHFVVLLYIAPLLVVLPHGVSYYSDYKSGYIKQILTRVSMKQYTRAKYISTFISGGSILIITMIIQFMVLATFLPLHKPQIHHGMLSGEITFGIELFYEHPFVFTLMWWIIGFVASGVFACIALIVSKFISNYFSILITPFVISFVFYVLDVLIKLPNYFFELRPNMSLRTNIWSLVIETILIFVITYFGFVRNKKEVY